MNVLLAVRGCAFFVLAVSLTLAFALFTTRAARADDRASLEAAATSSDPRVAADALFHLAEMEDTTFDFAKALAGYEACVARLPSTRWAPRAIARASALRGHAEGDFVPYARLERVRRDPSLANDEAAIDALARDADGFPPGAVRVEARMLAAEAYRSRFGRTADGMAELRKVVEDPKADVLTSRQAARELVETLANEGDLEGATRAVRELASKLDPKVAAGVRRRLRRRTAHHVAVADVSILLVLATVSFLLAWRQRKIGVVGRAILRLAPLTLAFAVYAAVVGGTLASSYESGNAMPFVCIGAATLVLVLVARAWAAAGSRAWWARIGRAAMCASSVIAAGFLLLEGIDPNYLEGFGL